MSMRFWMACSIVVGGACSPPSYDVVLVGGTVIDGTGSDRFRADVAIRGDRIVAVSRGEIERAGAERVIEAGRCRRPGQPVFDFADEVDQAGAVVAWDAHHPAR